MGWYYTYGASRKDIIEEVTKTYEDDRVRSETLARFFSGNCLWTVRESTQKVDGVKQRYICLYLLNRGRGDGWGYKPMSESSGPYYYSCPESFLGMVPCPGGYATEWREKVKSYWEQRRARSRAKKNRFGPPAWMLNPAVHRIVELR